MITGVKYKIEMLLIQIVYKNALIYTIYMEEFICPCCKGTHQTLRRYYDAVCNACLEQYGTKTKDGKKKEFSNIDIFGGIQCFCEGVKTEDFECFVNRIRCHAEEARFGGIVIRAYN